MEVETRITISDLCKIDLFTGLGDRWLETIKKICRLDILMPGTIVFTAGSEAKDIYLLLEGKVAIEIDLIVGQRRITTTLDMVGRGETFAWSALVEPRVLTASARCLERARVVTIEGSALLDLFEEYPGVGYVVMKNLSRIISRRLAGTRLAIQRELQALHFSSW